MKHRKTQLAAAVGAALFVLGTAAYGQAASPAMEVRAYGQVSRALLHGDDGVQSKWFHVDNEASGTRFGLTGTAQAMPGLRAGFRIEWDAQSNESQRVNFGAANPVSNFPAHDEDVGGFAERHMDAWIEASWGRVNIGQGDGAANGATESDLSGTGMANGIGVADLGGGFQHRTSAGVLGGATASVGATINQQDFESRYDRLMYTTPTFGGFRGQASWGQKANTDAKEISLWYGGRLGGFGELAAALGYSTRGASSPGTTHDVYYGASISWLHTSGFNLTGSWSERKNPTIVAGAAVRESTFQYIKAGWKFGQHAIAVDYALGDDFTTVGDEATMWGVGYVWNPIRWLELYAAYKVHELDRPGTSFGEIKIATIGTRVRF